MILIHYHLEEFRYYLDKKQNGLSKKWDNNAEELMTKVMISLNKKVCKNPKLENMLNFSYLVVI
jgi:hypothetical protein